MRELKFRAWINDEQCYSEEPFWRILLCKDGQIYNSENDTYYNYDERYTIEQFIGLKDKNGVYIYEGDIDKNGNVFMWSNELSLFCLHYFNTFNSEWKPSKYPLSKFDQYEVIGNIHENPELLK